MPSRFARVVVTARTLEGGIRPFEMPVYHSRFGRDGKRIAWRDGVRCAQILTRVRLTRAAPLDLVAAT